MVDSVVEVNRISSIAHETPSISTFLTNNVHLPRLVTLLSDPEEANDERVIAASLNVINFLIAESNAINRRRMAVVPNLLPRLKDIMMDFALPAKIKTQAIKAYTELEPHHKPSSSSSSSLSSSSSTNNHDSSDYTFSSKEVDADVINAEFPSNHHHHKGISFAAGAGPVGFGAGLGILSSGGGTPQATSVAPAGLALFSSRLSTAQTFTIFIKGLQSRPENKTALEQKLLSIKGVISFSIFEDKAIVRAVIGEQEVIKSIKEVSGLVPSSSTSGLDDKENAPPQYLNRERTSDASNKGKVALPDFKERTDDPGNSGWFGRVARALWG
jgi:hypothetical protein